MEIEDRKTHNILIVQTWLFVIFISCILTLMIAGYLTDLHYQKQKVNPFREMSQQDMTTIVTNLANKYNMNYDDVNKILRSAQEDTELNYLVRELGIRYVNNILDVINQDKLNQEAKKGKRK